MVKFSLDKKELERATALLNIVANLKSIGATPSETSGLTLTPTMLSLSNMNEANGVTIENLPIAVMEGDIGKHLDQTYMVNTKKLDSVVKGSKARVQFCIDEGKITIGENKRWYELAMFSTVRKEIPEVTLLGYSIEAKNIMNNFRNSALITDNSTNIAALSGSLFTGTSILSSDRICAIHIRNGGLFGEGVPDVVMSTDLFSACLAKLGDGEVLPGFTADNKRFVLRMYNTTVYKTMLAEAFPKDTILNAVNNVEKAVTDPSGQVASATISIEDFKAKLKEIHSIVESSEYYLSYHVGNNCMQLRNTNTRGGADGQAIIDASKVTVPGGLTAIEAKFSYLHLDLIGKIFPGDSEVTLFAALGRLNSANPVKYVGVRTESETYFFTPLASPSK